MRKSKLSFALLLTTSLFTYPFVSAIAQSIEIPAKGKSPTIDQI